MWARSSTTRRTSPTFDTRGSTSSSPDGPRDAGWGPTRCERSRYLIDERGHHRLTIDPAADNARAIRTYEKVGFRAVGTMREYRRSPDGAWRDGLLMDLLARELDRA